MNVDSDVVHVSNIPIPIPPGKWRKGTSHPKAKCILLRFSTRTDKKRPQAEKMSEYYKKYGNPNYGGKVPVPRYKLSTFRSMYFHFYMDIIET
jgi:hypothetical protein